MRAWDPSGVAAKLDLALEVFRKAKIEAQSQWDDPTSRSFDETFLVALEPKVNRAMEAIRHLDEVLRRAERECS